MYFSSNFHEWNFATINLEQYHSSAVSNLFWSPVFFTVSKNVVNDILQRWSPKMVQACLFSGVLRSVHVFINAFTSSGPWSWSRMLSFDLIQSIVAVPPPTFMSLTTWTQPCWTPLHLLALPIICSISLARTSFLSARTTTNASVANLRSNPRAKRRSSRNTPFSVFTAKFFCWHASAPFEMRLNITEVSCSIACFTLFPMISLSSEMKTSTGCLQLSSYTV